MFNMFRSYKAAIIIALGLTLVELFVELIQPYLISKIIDDGIMDRNLSVIWTRGVILLGCTLTAFAAGIINSFYSAHVSQSFGFDLRERLYEKVQKFTFQVFNRFPAATLITRLTNDVLQIQNTVFMALRIMLRAPLLVIGGAVMAIAVNPGLAFYLALSVPFLTIFLLWVLRKAEKLFRVVQERLDDVNGVMRENLIGMRLIRAFVRSKSEADRFADSGERLAHRTKLALRVTETTMPAIMLVMNIGIIVVLWMGGKRMDSSDATVGEIVAIVNYAMRMTAALSIMSMIIMGYSRAKASIRRIGEILNTEEDIGYSEAIEESARIKEGNIEFNNVSFRYPDSQDAALHHISFSAKAGNIIAIMGATGAGKSSLFQLIPRLYEPTSGSVHIDGINAGKLPLDHLRRQIGYVPQETQLFSGTIRDNITWGNEEASLEEIEKAARRAQIHDTIAAFPQGYDTVLGQRGVNLSGGQKQRLAIARAFVRNPRILLLDDCTSALDALTETKLMLAIKSYPCTTLLITQKISAAMNADAVLLLEDGSLLASGTHNELLSSSALYREIYRSQFGEEAAEHVQSHR